MRWKLSILYDEFDLEGRIVELYTVPVCNELTGEMEIVSVSCGSCLDAQVEALRLVFRNQGWQKARALQAERVEAAEQEDGAVA